MTQIAPETGTASVVRKGRWLPDAKVQTYRAI